VEYTHLWTSADGETHIQECAVAQLESKGYSGSPQLVREGRTTLVHTPSIPPWTPRCDPFPVCWHRPPSADECGIHGALCRLRQPVACGALNTMGHHPQGLVVCQGLRWHHQGVWPRRRPIPGLATFLLPPTAGNSPLLRGAPVSDLHLDHRTTRHIVQRPSHRSTTRGRQVEDLASR
jgi:hypothetical protein